MKARRIAWIDVLRGLGIILIVLGHTHASFRQYLYTFHIPLFFFASGLVFKPRPNVLDQIVRRARGLLVPYLFFSGVSLVLYPLITGQEVPIATALRQVVLSVRSHIDVNQTLWFLTCMFATQVLYTLIERVVKNPWLVVAVALPLSVVGYRAVEAPVLPFSADAALYFVLFVALGRLFASLGELQNHKVVLAACSLALIPVGYLLSAPSVASRIVGFSTQGALVVRYAWGLALALLGIAAMTRLAVLLQDSVLLARLGRSSLTIFALHMFVVEGAFYALSALGLQVNQAANSYAILTAAAAIAVVLPIARSLEENCGFLVGMPSPTALPAQEEHLAETA